MEEWWPVHMSGHCCTKKYLRGHVYTKKFSDFTEAEDYVLDHITEKAPFGCPVPVHCRLNEIIFTSKLLKFCE